MEACRSAGQYSTVLQLYDEMLLHGIEPGVFNSNVAIDACSKCSSNVQTSNVQSSNAQESNSQVSNGAQWRRALNILRTVTTPDVVSYTAAMHACNKGGQWQRSLQLFDELVASVKQQQQQQQQQQRRQRKRTSSSSSSSGSSSSSSDGYSSVLALNVQAYTAAIDACAKGQQWERAQQLLQVRRYINKHYMPKRFMHAV
jgi:pentatricopeptide repeat domain-containing protein 1